ncbi:Copiatype Polyprotein [Phytophthora palmivora]|uniref:Copiatype Polyprotein n=1 Tax=Phytophthora palmivora TaxID=4796 RepID=A0A2P4XEV0_9STRA|nr:Copiatype Polyprotein [Phytophthora palmivora]
MIQILVMEMFLFTLDGDEDHVEIDESSGMGNESEVASKREDGVNVKIAKSKPETVDVSALLPVQQSGKRTHREETQSKEIELVQGFVNPMNDECRYTDDIMLVLVYVDVVLVATNNEKYKQKLYMDLDETYGMKDQGLLKSYLGIEVEQTDDHITIRQSKYRQAIGMLMYLAMGTRPDLALAVGQLSRFVAKSSAKHIGSVKRLAGTVNLGIAYKGMRKIQSKIVLDGFCDSDWANDP